MNTGAAPMLPLSQRNARRCEGHNGCQLVPSKAYAASLTADPCGAGKVISRNWGKAHSLVLLLLLFVGACAGVNEPKNYGEFLSRAYQEGNLDRNQASNEQARRVFEKLRKTTAALYPEASSWDWRINIPNYPRASVYGWRRANIVVYEGFFQKASPTDDELAMAIAHELAHLVLKHHDQGEELRRSGVSQINVNHARRQFEIDADKLGVDIAVSAGYKREAMASLFKKMIIANPHTAGAYDSAYPTWEARIEQVGGR